jgi:hypothetical protein
MTPKDRLDICHACSNFKKSTGSCGKLIVGETIDHNGKKVRLCGCVMYFKTQMKTASCPLGFWNKNFLYRKQSQLKKV